MSRLPPLFFQKYKFFLEVNSPMMLPSYKGSTFRGGALTAFKEEVCLTPDGECDNCPLTKHCSYYYLFESKQLASSLGVSMSYIVEPPLTERRMFDIGDELSFSVVLIGKATIYWNLLIYVVKKLGETSGIGRRVDGRRGRFQLKRVDSVGLNDSSVTVYSSEHSFPHDKPITLTGEDVAQIGDANRQIDELTDNQTGRDAISNTQYVLRFLTPVRFIENIRDGKENTRKRFVTDFDFALLMQELIRRLGRLSEAYCEGHRPELENLLERVSDVRTAERLLLREQLDRYSRRQDMRYPMDGLKGFLQLEGNLEPFMPYLRLGEWLHLGKQTTFGLGQYQITEVKQ